MVPLYSSKITRVPLYSRKFISVTSKGLSPAVVSFSKLFKLTYKRYWPIPPSLATTNGVSIDFFSSGYLDVSVPRVRLSIPMYSVKRYPQAGGFPHSDMSGSKSVCRLPEPFRRLQRPSSPLTAKASTVHAYSLDHITRRRLIS